MGPKKQGFWPKINCSQIKLPNLGLHPLTVGQKVPILDFQSEFFMSKIVQIFLIFFSLNLTHLGGHEKLYH